MQLLFTDEVKKGRRTRDEKIRYPLLAVPSLVADLVADHSNPCSTPNPQSPIEHFQMAYFYNSRTRSFEKIILV